MSRRSYLVLQSIDNTDAQRSTSPHSSPSPMSLTPTRCPDGGDRAMHRSELHVIPDR